MKFISKYGLAFLLSIASINLCAIPVDLSSWTANGTGTWVLQGGNDSVKQTINDEPTIFHNGVNSQGQQLSGQITVQTTDDDDFIGFVLGYHDNDVNSAAVNYLLIDWKQANQTFNGGLGLAGLAISRVTSVLDDASDSAPWWHDAADGVTELARATNLGNVGWVDNQTYSFDLVFTSSLVQIFVDGIQELSISGSFSDGSFGFYNYSQADVLYAGITQQATVPAPMSIALFGIGLIGFGFSKKKK